MKAEKKKLKFRIGDLVLIKKLVFKGEKPDPDMNVYLRKIGRIISKHSTSETYPYTVKFYKKYKLEFDESGVDFAEEELELVNKTTKILYG